MDSVRVTLRLVFIVCAVTAVPLGTTSPFVDSYIPPQVSPNSAPEQIFQVQRDETAITSVGQTVDTPVENTSTTADSKPTTGDPKFVITPVNVEHKRDTRNGRSDGDVSDVPAESPRDMINGLPFIFLNAFPFSFFPSFQFPMTFPFNKNNYNIIGVQSSESVWSTVRPGPNRTVITEIHHQSGDSPTEVAYYVNGTEVKHEAVPSLLQELQEYDRNNKGKDPNNPALSHTYEKEGRSRRIEPAVSHTYEKEGRSRRIEPDVSHTYEKEGRSRRIESLMDEVDGKNLRNLIRILQAIQMRIDLFRKDVAEILTPIVYNFNPIETLPPPVPHRPHITEEKPESPPTRTEEKPSKTEEKPSKTEEKPIKIEEKPTKIEDKPEEKPTKTEEKPVEAKPTKTEEKPTTTDEKPTKTEEKPTKTEEKPVEAKPTEEKPTKTDEKPAETPTKTDNKPAEASSEPPKTNPIASMRQARSPDRGYGGPYPYGGGLFRRRPYYGGSYGGRYPYYGYNHGWVPVYGR